MIITLAQSTPTLLLDYNKKRTRLVVQMQATQVDSANTGKVFIGFNFQPTATVGHQSQGEVLIQSAAIDEPKGGDKLNEKFKGQIWAVADTASQSVIVEEETEI